MIEPTIEEEMLDFIEQAAGPVDLSIGTADFRANVPAGTVLAESAEVEGSKIQITKGRSMVAMDGNPLPERTRVYDTRTGRSSDVPTAQLRYQLGKRRDDGSRVYSLKKPDVPEAEPIAETCQICYRNRGNRHRNFYSEDALLQHMQAFHGLEWAAMERDREIKARREDSARLERLIMGLAQALNPAATAKLDPEVRLQLSEMQEKAFTCETCGFVAASAFGLQAHQRKHSGEE